jgi:hypothetical protein
MQDDKGLKQPVGPAFQTKQFTIKLIK